MLKLYSKEKYQFIRYRLEHKEQLSALWESTWGICRPLSLRIFEWKYENNPYLRAPLVYLALHAGQVVGAGGLYGIKWEGDCPRQELMALGIGDMMVRPNHECCGILRRLRQAALDDLAVANYDYLLATSAEPATYLRGLRAGWRPVGRYEPLIWRNRAGTIGSGIRRSKIFCRLRGLSQTKPRLPFYTFDRKYLHREFKSEFRVSADLKPKPKEMADLIRRIPYNGHIRHVRDEEYFRWRFGNPLGAYRFLFCEDSALEGYLVLQISNNSKQQIARIVDWEAIDMTVREELLNMALFYMGDGVLTTWSATYPDNVKRLLQSKGFTPHDDSKGAKRYKPGIILRPVQNRLLNESWTFADRRLLDINNWDLRMVYSDAY